MSGPTLNYQPRVEWLDGNGRNDFTQFGEDGLIEAVFDEIGETCCECFEVGAADGRFFSNTLRLRQQGWRAVLMESDRKAFDKLHAEFGTKSECIYGQVTNLDNVLTTTSISIRPDLGVIDIDGQDYWLWHDMVAIRPRVMLVEIAIVDQLAPVPPRGEPGQAGLHAIEALGFAKGYRCVATTYCNALFVDKACLS